MLRQALISGGACCRNRGSRRAMGWRGVRRFREAPPGCCRRLLYIKKMVDFIEPENVQRLADSKVIVGIKYATVRTDPAEDEYLRRLGERVERG